MLQFIGEDELLMRGRCREHAAVSRHGTGANGFAVLFIKEIVLTAGNTGEHSIQLASSNNILTARGSYTNQLELLVTFLCEKAQHECPYVIVRCDKVEDEAVHRLSNAGIYLVSTN